MDNNQSVLCPTNNNNCTFLSAAIKLRKKYGKTSNFRS